MNQPISSGLRTTFLAHTIVGLAFGLPYLLAPEAVGALVNWDMSDPAYRTLGAALIALAVSSWSAYRARLWRDVRIVVVLEIVWTVLGAAVAAWGLLTGTFPPIGWLNLAVLVVFALAFSYFYLQAQSAAAGQETGDSALAPH